MPFAMPRAIPFAMRTASIADDAATSVTLWGGGVMGADFRFDVDFRARFGETSRFP